MMKLFLNTFQLTHINDAFWDGQQLYSAMTPPCDIDYWIGKCNDTINSKLSGEHRSNFASFRCKGPFIIYESGEANILFFGPE